MFFKEVKIVENKITQMVGKREMNIEEVAKVLKEKLTSNATGAEFIMERERNIGEGKGILMIFDKMYFRTGAVASLTILLSEDEEEQNADVIGHGGGAGAFKVSWGANEDFAKRAEDILKECGFDVCEEEGDHRVFPS